MNNMIYRLYYWTLKEELSICNIIEMAWHYEENKRMREFVKKHVVRNE